jgi:hypothetical protein
MQSMKLMQCDHEGCYNPISLRCHQCNGGYCVENMKSIPPNGATGDKNNYLYCCISMYSKVKRRMFYRLTLLH